MIYMVYMIYIEWASPIANILLGQLVTRLVPILEKEQHNKSTHRVRCLRDIPS